MFSNRVNTSEITTWSLGAAAQGFLNPEYPAAISQILQGLATRLIEVGTVSPGVDFVVPAGGTVNVQLFHNGVAVPGWIITYAAGDSGKKTLPSPPPTTIAVGDTFSLQVNVTGPSEEFIIGATIGVL